MAQRKPLNSTQIKIVAAKANGEKKIGSKIFPNQTPNAAAVSVSKELKKPNVQEALALAFEKHGITIDRAVKPIADGLEATKLDEKRGYIEDHTIRLKASGMAFNLMGINKNEGGTTNNFLIISEGQKEKYGM